MFGYFATVRIASSASVGGVPQRWARRCGESGATVTEQKSVSGDGSGQLPRRRLGASGIEMSALGLGCWALGGPDHNLGLPMGWSTGPDATVAVEALEAGYKTGVRLFDTADVYGHGRSERLLGRLVAQVPREDVVLVSKVGYFTGTAEHGFTPGHMRRQVEQSLENLRTDYLDVYFLHHSEFGDQDRWLAPALEVMRSLRSEGLIRAVGMRGPHRFALDRLTEPAGMRADKVARFRELFDRVRPDVLAVRDNLLTPRDRSAGVFAFAAAHGVGVLVNKVLGQGLLTGRYDPARPPVFGPGDHRSRKRWFTPAALAVIDEGLARLKETIGSSDPEELIRVALWAALSRADHAAVLVGFTNVQQVRVNVAAVASGPPPAEVIDAARQVMSRVQAQLDADGPVFVDEPLAAAPSRTADREGGPG